MAILMHEPAFTIPLPDHPMAPGMAAVERSR